MNLILIPPEMISYIICFLDHDDIINMSRVCIYFYNIIKTTTIQKIYIPKERIYIHPFFINICFKELVINIAELIKLQNVRNIILGEIIIDDDCHQYIFTHLLNIGCKNIIFNNKNDFLNLSKYFTDEINCYVYDGNLSIIEKNNSSNIIYSKKIHQKIFDNFDSYHNLFIRYITMYQFSYDIRKNRIGYI